MISTACPGSRLCRNRYRPPSYGGYRLLGQVKTCLFRIEFPVYKLESAPASRHFWERFLRGSDFVLVSRCNTGIKNAGRSNRYGARCEGTASWASGEGVWVSLPIIPGVCCRAPCAVCLMPSSVLSPHAMPLQMAPPASSNLGRPSKNRGAGPSRNPRPHP